MDSTSSTSGEKAKRISLFFIGFVVILAFISTLIAYLWYKAEEPVEVAEDNNRNFGLEASPSGDELSNGYLYFSAVSNESPDEVSIYAYDLSKDSNNIHSVLVGGTHFAFEWVNENYGLFVAPPLPENAGSDDVLPAWINFSTGEFDYFDQVFGYREQSLSATSDFFHLAYMMQPQRTDTGLALEDLDNWEVVVINPTTGDSLQLENAGFPTWLSNNELLFVKKDGIYWYNLDTQSTGIFVDWYQNLGYYTDIAVADDGRTMVMTDASLGIISIFDLNGLDDGDIAEVGSIQTEGIKYGKPVVSPDNIHYAVVALSDSGDVKIEIRQLNSREVVRTVSLPDFVSSSIVLDDWSNALIPEPLQELEPNEN